MPRRMRAFNAALLRVPMENRFSMEEPPSATRAVSFDEFVDQDRPIRKGGSGPKRKLELWRARARVLLERKDFAAFGPSELVGLYCELHAHVYGVAPAEVQTTNVLKAAAGGAARIIKNTFDGDNAEAVQFVWWVWQREGKREKQRRRGGEDGGGGRIGWRLQFVSPALVTDYMVARQRLREAGRRRK